MSGSRKFIDVLFEHAKKLLEFFFLVFSCGISRAAFLKWVLEDVMNLVLFIRELAFCAFPAEFFL